MFLDYQRHGLDAFTITVLRHLEEEDGTRDRMWQIKERLARSYDDAVLYDTYVGRRVIRGANGKARRARRPHGVMGYVP